MSDEKSVQYRLELTTDAFEKNLSAAKKQFEDFSKSISEGVGIGAGIEIFKGLEEGIKHAVGAIPELVEHLMGLGHEMENIHEKTGITVEALQKWKFAGDIVGVSVDQMASAVAKFDKGLDNSAPKVIDALQRIGLSAQSVAHMSDDMKVETIMEHLGRIEAGGTRTALAMALFGKAGAEMLPLASTFKALGASAESLGVIMDTKTLAAAADLHKETAMLGSVIQGLGNNFAGAIAMSEPLHVAMNTLVHTFGDLSVWVQKNQSDIRAYVDGGVVFLAQAFVEMVKVVEVGGAVFKGLLDIWSYAKQSAKDLGAGLLLLNEIIAADSVAKVKSAWEEYGKTVARTGQETAKEIADHQTSLNSFMGTTLKVKNAGELLVTNLQAVAGGHHEAAEASGAHVEAGEKLEKKTKELAEAHLLLHQELSILGPTMTGTDDKIAEMISVFDRFGGATNKSKEDIAKFAEGLQKHIPSASADGQKAIQDFIETLPGMGVTMRTVESDVEKEFKKLQNEMTLASKTGVDKRLAEIEIGHQKELESIAALKGADAAIRDQMVAMSTTTYDKMKLAAKGYYDSASEFAAAHGLKTRAEIAQTSTAYHAGLEQMRVAGEITTKELDKMWTEFLKKTGQAHKLWFETAKGQYEEISHVASGILKEMFGKHKAAAIAAVVIDVAAGVVKDIGAYPWPWWIPPVAATVAAGAAQVAKIEGVSFAQGTPDLGFQDFGSGTAAMLHGREAIVPEGRAADFAAQHSSMGGGAISLTVVNNFDVSATMSPDVKKQIVDAVEEGLVNRVGTFVSTLKTAVST